MPGVRFLGQSIEIGEYSGFPTNRTIITSNGSAFSILQYFIDNGGFTDTSRVVICKDNNGDNIFAIGYQHTDLYGLRTFLKLANSVDGLIPDDDTIPTVAPWNGWIMTGTNNPSYAGFDPDDLTLEDLILNSFTLYRQNQLYPYYQWGYGERTAEFCRDNAPIDCIISLGLKNYDATTPVNYTVPTPYMVRSGPVSFTNWIDGDTVTDPSYALGDIGFGSKWIYNPLNILNAWEMDHFDKDPSGPGGGVFGSDYGYGGDDFIPGGPISLNAIDTGFVSLFSPTKTQLWNLHDYLWTSNFVDNLKKLYTDPMEAIISFGILPVNLDPIKDLYASSVVIGNVNTGIEMYKLNDQYIEVDMGTVTVPENWTSALDYGNFTRAEMYLPFCGYVPLKVDDVMDATVNVHYVIDVLSGDCAIQIVCKKKFKTGRQRTAMVYQHHGNCLIHVPIMANSYANYYKNQIDNAVSLFGNAASLDLGGAMSSAMKGLMDSITDGPDLQRSGNYSGSMAALSERRPCLFLYRHIQHMPQDYGKYVGYPSFITYVLDDLEGYTQIESVIDNTVSKATDAERAEIEKLLKEGVILP